MSHNNVSAVRTVLTDHPELYSGKGGRDDMPVPPGGAPIQERPEIAELRSRLVGTAPPQDADREQFVQHGAAAVADMKGAYEKAGMIVMCKTMNDLVKALAEDDGTSIEAAREKAFNNSARGFTAEKTGIIYMRNVKEKDHDIVHELIHASSAPGGTTKIKTVFGDPLNEGFTEFFAIDYCKALNVKPADAYPLEVAFVRRLEGAVGAAMLFDAYMKNAGMGAIVTALSSRWLERGPAFAGDQSLQAFVPPQDPQQRAAALVERLKDGAFLKSEPAAFWNALLT